MRFHGVGIEECVSIDEQGLSAKLSRDEMSAELVDSVVLNALKLRTVKWKATVRLHCAFS